MSYIDMHCDTLMLGKFLKEDLNASKKLTVTFEKMKKADALAQFFAIFMPDEKVYEHFNLKPMKDKEYFDALFELYLASLKEHADIIKPAHTLQDLKDNQKKGLMSAILTIEDGRMVNSDFEKLEDFYDLGVRAIALTWNYENCFGYPNSEDEAIMNKGLKSFGKDAVDFMNELGILVDVSHLSDGGFWDVAEIINKPFIATHSNCRALSPHRRNLTDEMIKALADKGGVMGLNMCPDFLAPTAKSNVATIDLMVAHIKHMVEIGGIGVAALGSDFDGMDGELEIADCSQYPKLFERLKKEGFHESDIDKITHENVMRVMKETLW